MEEAEQQAAIVLCQEARLQPDLAGGNPVGRGDGASVFIGDPYSVAVNFDDLIAQGPDVAAALVLGARGQSARRVADGSEMRIEG